MTTTNSTVLRVMNVLFWIVFIGFCIKTVAILISFLISLFVNSEGAANLYMGYDMSELYSYSKQYYIFTVSLLLVLNGLKTYIAYCVVKFFMKFNLSKPFNHELTDLFLSISHISLGLCVLALIAALYCKWILKKGIAVPIDFDGGEILFFAGIIYILALVFKKGADLQTESDLTV
ncbi:DUF2975 domain-containing protein [Sinomicrobium sp.]